MPYTALGAFLGELRARPGTAARALEFLILCASRTGEVLGARWDEIDLAQKTWTVPAARMKATRTMLCRSPPRRLRFSMVSLVEANVSLRHPERACR
jgi:integrase